MVKDHFPARKKIAINQSDARPLIIAHRGASRYAPENTVPAIRLAVDSGAEGVEFDVRLAKDGAPVVIHDGDLRRTGSRNERVAALTSKELARVDVGSWFNARYPKLAKGEFAGCTVPALADLLELLRGFHGLVYVELKGTAADQAALTKAVCDLVRSSPLLPQIVIKSFRLAAVSVVRAQLPDVQTAALFDPASITILRRRKYLVDLAQKSGARQLSLHRSLITPKLTELAARANMPVTVWTTDSAKWIGRCRKLGIGALITNDPARMLAARYEDS